MLEPLVPLIYTAEVPMLGISVRLLGHLNLDNGHEAPKCCGRELTIQSCLVIRGDKKYDNTALCSVCGRSYFAAKQTEICDDIEEDDADGKGSEPRSTPDMIAVSPSEFRQEALPRKEEDAGK